jgi:hypothetical protein
MRGIGEPVQGWSHETRALEYKLARKTVYGKIDPNVAKAGAIQSQDAKGAAVVIYCNPLATPDLDGSGFPARGTT